MKPPRCRVKRMRSASSNSRRRRSPRDVPSSMLPDTDNVQRYLTAIGAHRLMTAEEEHETATRAAAGDFEARQSMIERNLRLVVSIAKHYANRGPGAARPDRGRQPRPDPRAGEVRPRTRLPLFHLRDLVDPPDHRACGDQPGADDPPAGARRARTAARDPREAPPRDGIRRDRPRGPHRGHRAPDRQERRRRRGRPAVRRHPGVARCAARRRPRQHAGGPPDRRWRPRRRRRARFGTNWSCACTSGWRG